MVNKTLLYFGVLYSFSSLFVSSYIHQNLSGLLSESWRINFEMFIDDFKGIILYSFDSEFNHFGIIIIPGSNGSHKIKLKFNNTYKIIPLRSFCGCNPCANKAFTFEITKRLTTINGSCNHNLIHTWEISTGQIKEQESPEYLTPEFLVNVTRMIYLCIGNTGAYIGKGNVAVFLKKHELSGCLNTFYYNDTIITFKKEGRNIETFCINKCFRDTCHGGQCLILKKSKIKCDCSATALNGPFCNRSLHNYYLGGNNSYIKNKDDSSITIKMTWKSALEKTYCLMEIDARTESIIIRSNKSHVMINDAPISNINGDRINFFNVMVAKDYINIKIKESQFSKQFPFDDDLKINIGVPKGNRDCEIFEGIYDLDISKLQHKEIVKREKDEPLSRIIKILIFTVISATFIFSVTIVTLFYFHTRRVMERLETINDGRESLRLGVYTESDLYNTVEDNSNYDSLDDKDLYAQVITNG